MSTSRTGRTRTSILDAARALIEADPHAWTMEDIAVAAGVTRMTVYRYFHSRTDLLVETVQHVDEVEGAVRRFEPVYELATGIETLDAWIRIWADYIPHIAPMARALLSARSHDEAAAKAWDDRMTALRRGPATIAERLERDGTLAPDLTAEAAADLIWAIGSFQVWEALTGDRGWSPNEYQEHLRATLCRALTEP
jgi:AcrR family transcriptional regulator